MLWCGSEPMASSQSIVGRPAICSKSVDVFGACQPLLVNLVSFVSQLGFLYLRYVLNPRSVWDWLQYYIKDHEVRFCASERSANVQVGGASQKSLPA